MSTAPLAAAFDVSPLRGSVLIVPTVSTGNVPQLLGDLVVSSAAESPFARIGSLASPYVLNVVGPDAFGSPNHLAMPIEVYHSPARKLTLLQLRSPVIQGFGAQFSQALYAWAQSVGFKQVLVLASADAAYRTDSLIEGTPSFRHLHIATSDPPLSLTTTETKHLESELAQDCKLPGSGFLAPLVATAREHQSTVPTAVFLTFAMEGDNLQDTMMAFAKVANVVGLRGVHPRPPVSWAELYGAQLALDVAREVY
ncbi:PAC2 family-domain-containing protein [Catenaria anguillulae PL171]|uniref:Proteasome assembly chaperone 2 n=1 Tax=Catenaria anguillulae PL171 TaxID=765915 RepID=A0A1Y2HKD6_9FUNG|nr:PAC2 family-domain-containing protein [Catenaria anguillulae PL171]